MRIREPLYPTRLIWGAVYPYLTERSALFNPTQVKMKMVPDTGIKKIDKARLNELALTHTNIDRMYELWKQRYTIKIPNLDDKVNIYLCVQEYLYHWASLIERTAGAVLTVPIEDLKGLDRFAQALYDEILDCNYIEFERIKPLVIEDHETSKFRNVMDVRQTQDDRRLYKRHSFLPGIVGSGESMTPINIESDILDEFGIKELL